MTFTPTTTFHLHPTTIALSGSGVSDGDAAIFLNTSTSDDCTGASDLMQASAGAGGTVVGMSVAVTLPSALYHLCVAPFNSVDSGFGDLGDLGDSSFGVDSSSFVMLATPLLSVIPLDVSFAPTTTFDLHPTSIALSGSGIADGDAAIFVNTSAQDDCTGAAALLAASGDAGRTVAGLAIYVTLPTALYHLCVASASSDLASDGSFVRLSTPLLDVTPLNATFTPTTTYDLHPTTITLSGSDVDDGATAVFINTSAQDDCAGAAAIALGDESAGGSVVNLTIDVTLPTAQYHLCLAPAGSDADDDASYVRLPSPLLVVITLNVSFTPTETFHLDQTAIALTGSDVADGDAAIFLNTSAQDGCAGAAALLSSSDGNATAGGLVLNGTVNVTLPAALYHLCLAPATAEAQLSRDGSFVRLTTGLLTVLPPLPPPPSAPPSPTLPAIIMTFSGVSTGGTGSTSKVPWWWLLIATAVAALCCCIPLLLMCCCLALPAAAPEKLYVFQLPDLPAAAIALDAPHSKAFPESLKV